MNSITQAIDFSQKLQQARTSMQVRNYAEALHLYAQLAKEARHPEFWTEYGQAAGAAGEFDLAEQLWDKVLISHPKSANLLMQIAHEYGKMWLFTKARALSFDAAALETSNFEAQLSLASFLARTNSIAEAREAVEKCLKLDPKSEAAHYLIANLCRRENKLAEAEQRLRDLQMAGLRDPKVNYLCHVELARVLDSTGRFDEAMAQLEESKRLAAQNINITDARKTFADRRERILRKTRALQKNILKVWAESFPPQARTPAPPLAFLGGHARSGTTLLERILDAHPSITGCDEALAFPTIGPSIDATIPNFPADKLNFLRQRYLKNLLKVIDAPAEGKTLLDKNPPVTAYLSAFLRVFPELKVLIALRDPRDVVVSCYFQNLVQITNLNFGFLAQHYCCVMDVWLMVREWEGLTWMETRYEDVVADLRKEGSRVTKFLGLEWHEDQAKFYEKNREKPVMSSNYNDVTQPVYKRSVGRWQAYEKYLAPILPVLEPYCKKFGYG